MSTSPSFQSALTVAKSLRIFHNVGHTLLERLTEEDMRYYAHEEVLFREGEPAESLYIILHGQVNIFNEGVYILSRDLGDIVGEQSFIDRSVRSATAIAQGSVEALVLDRTTVEEFMSDAAFAQNLLTIVSRKLSDATRERAYHYRNEMRLFSEFRSHVSPEVANHLLAVGEDYGRPRYIDAAILQTDIRDFTRLSDTLTPEQVSVQLSEYLDDAVETVHRFRGIVDKFVGDSVLAIWGYSHAENPADLALECARALVIQASQLSFAGEQIRIGVGINYGRVFVGNIGSKGKRQFTVLGSPVNFTSRLETQSKAVGAPIVAGSDLYERLSPELKTGGTLDRRDVPGMGLTNMYLFKVEA